MHVPFLVTFFTGTSTTVNFEAEKKIDRGWLTIILNLTASKYNYEEEFLNIIKQLNDIIAGIF